MRPHNENTQRVDSEQVASPARLRRRTLLAGAGGLGAGAAAAFGVQALRQGQPAGSEAPSTTTLVSATHSFYGEHQSGIATPAQAYARFIAVDLNKKIRAEAIERMLRILTGDAGALSTGTAPLVDQEPELASSPANLTVTVGLGARIFDIVAPHKKPAWLGPLPAFSIDKLQDKYSGGDLFLQICCDDTTTLSHAQRMLVKDIRTFGTIRWVQEGFLRAFGAGEGTPRNLFGQVDGTVNPTEDPAQNPGRGGASLDDIVWGAGDAAAGYPQAWEPGGAAVVIRRIHMNLDTWDEVDTPAREDAVGRKLSNGAPLTGEHEFDDPDFEKTNELGFEMIAPYAHIRRAQPAQPWERILRRGYNYDMPVFNAGGFSKHGDTAGGVSDAGLIFVAYQADPLKQYVPIQRRLEKLDMLNTWTVPVGSAVFAIPAGCPGPDRFIGQSLFS